MKDLFYIFIFGILLSACSTLSTVKEVAICPIPNTNLVKVLSFQKKDSLANFIQIYGSLKEYQSRNELLFGSIAVYKNDTLLIGDETDWDGNFSLELANWDETAIYDIEFTYLGFYNLKVDSLLLDPKFTYKLKCLLVKTNSQPNPIIATKCNSPPIIKADNMTKGQIFTSEQIKHSATGKN